MKTINCPYCNTELELPPKAKGKNVKCPDCSRKFRIDETGVAITAEQWREERRRRKIERRNARKVRRSILLRKADKVLRNHQILASVIVASLALIIYGWIQYNTDRYTFNFSYGAKILDKNTGTIYHGVGSGRKIYEL